MLDGLHDTLKARKRDSGSSMVIICRSAGIAVREAVSTLQHWGFYEAEGLHQSLWEDPKDWPSRWAIKYSYDMQDHSPELAERHRALNIRLKRGEADPLPVGSREWRKMEDRKANGECQAPIIVGFEGMGRGIHFDGVETAYVLGLPRKPSIYMHLAGRVGRLGHNQGKVVSVLPKRGSKVLDAWASQIGPGVRFEEEPIQRIRSRPAVTPPKKLTTPSEAWNWRDERGEEEYEEGGVPLLTEGEEYVPVPGNYDDERGQKRELEQVRAAVRRSRQPDGVAARRIRAKLARVTNPYA